MITVNDYSPDHVLDVLTAYADTHSFLKVVDLTRNFGQHAAMMAGLSYTSGDWIVFLDDDGQCPMDHLWELLAPLHEDMMFPSQNTSLRNARNRSSVFSAAVSMMRWYVLFWTNQRDLTVSNFIAMRSFIADERSSDTKNPYPFTSMV